jgi:glycosyltransferase involved in cell wall biosynthesis
VERDEIMAVEAERQRATTFDARARYERARRDHELRAADAVAREAHRLELDLDALDAEIDAVRRSFGWHLGSAATRVAHHAVRRIRRSADRAERPVAADPTTPPPERPLLVTVTVVGGTVDERAATLESLRAQTLVAWQAGFTAGFPSDDARFVDPCVIGSRAGASGAAARACVSVPAGTVLDPTALETALWQAAVSTVAAPAVAGRPLTAELGFPSPGELLDDLWRLPAGTGRPVVLVTPFLARVGGGERLVRVLAEQARSTGRTVVVVGTVPLPPETASSVEELRALTPFVYDLTAVPDGIQQDALVELISRLSQPVVVNFGATALNDVVPRLASTVWGCSLVDVLFNHLGHLADNLRNAPYLERTLTITERLRRCISDGYDPEYRLETFYVGMPPPAPRSPGVIELDRAPWRRTDLPVVGWVGRLSSEKRPDWVVTLAERCAARADVVVAGEGPLGSVIRDAEGRLPALHWIGTVPLGSDLIRQCDLLVLTSEVEGIPQVVMEALALGVPVVVTDVGGNDEVVQHGINGLVLDPDDRDGFAAAVEDLLGDPDRLAVLRTGAAAGLPACFEQDAMVAQWIALLGELDEQPASRPRAVRRADRRPVPASALIELARTAADAAQARWEDADRQRRAASAHHLRLLEHRGRLEQALARSRAALDAIEQSRAQVLAAPINRIAQRLAPPTGPTGAPAQPEPDPAGPHHWPVRLPAPGPDAPTVSLVMACYNPPEVVAGTVASVQAQTLTDWELIVWNDGSDDDDAVARINAIADLGDPRIRIFAGPNRGLVGARNQALWHARGQFVMPLDADDLLASTYLEKAVVYLRARPDIDLVTPEVALFGDETGTWVPGPPTAQGLLLENRCAVSSIARRSVYERTRGFSDHQAAGYEDWEHWTRAVRLGATAALLPEPLFHYRVRRRSGLYREHLRRHDEQARKLRAANRDARWQPDPVRLPPDRLGDAVAEVLIGPASDRRPILVVLGTPAASPDAWLLAESLAREVGGDHPVVVVAVGDDTPDAARRRAGLAAAVPHLYDLTWLLHHDDHPLALTVLHDRLRPAVVVDLGSPLPLPGPATAVVRVRVDPRTVTIADAARTVVARGLGPWWPQADELPLVSLLRADAGTAPTIALGDAAHGLLALAPEGHRRVVWFDQPGEELEDVRAILHGVDRIELVTADDADRRRPPGDIPLAVVPRNELLTVARTADAAVVTAPAVLPCNAVVAALAGTPILVPRSHLAVAGAGPLLVGGGNRLEPDDLRHALRTGRSRAAAPDAPGWRTVLAATMSAHT